MITVGLTGGIGSGKSYISRVFEELNIPLFKSDQQAKLAYQNPDIQRDVINLLGSKSIVEGQADTQYIASKIFDDENALIHLNAIIHPWLEKRFLAWTDSLSDYPYCIKEAAILFETDLYKKLDFTICVVAQEKLRISRVIDRDHTSEEEIKKRMTHQWSDEKKLSLADFVIQNNGELLLPQILAIHQHLIKLHK